MLHIVYGFEIRAAMFSDYQLFYIDLKRIIYSIVKKITSLDLPAWHLDKRRCYMFQLDDMKN